MINNMKKTLKSNSTEQTKAFAKELAKEISPGSVICMYGDLGAGKTAFVQGMADALNSSDYVSSPTFTIVNEYNADIPIYHFDVYRISDSEEMFEIGFEEYLYGNGIVIIEWAELIEDILPKERINITINRDMQNPETDREIIIEVIK